MCFSVQSLGWEDPLEGGMATYSNILAWRILWSEEPGGLQPIRLQRVRHNWSDWAWCIFKYILLPQVFLSLYSHLTRGALGISNPHMNFGDIWDRDPCSWSLEYKVKWIVIINVLNVRCDRKNGVTFDFNFLPWKIGIWSCFSTKLEKILKRAGLGKLRKKIKSSI